MCLEIYVLKVLEVQRKFFLAVILMLLKLYPFYHEIPWDKLLQKCMVLSLSPICAMSEEERESFGCFSDKDAWFPYAAIISLAEADYILPPNAVQQLSYMWCFFFYPHKPGLFERLQLSFSKFLERTFCRHYISVLNPENL